MPDFPRWIFVLPLLWLIGLVLMLWLPLVLKRRVFGNRPGLLDAFRCPSCSYSLIGLPPLALCPECGASRNLIQETSGFAFGGWQVPTRTHARMLELPAIVALPVLIASAMHSLVDWNIASRLLAASVPFLCVYAITGVNGIERMNRAEIARVVLVPLSAVVIVHIAVFGMFGSFLPFTLFLSPSLTGYAMIPLAMGPAARRYVNG